MKIMDMLKKVFPAPKIPQKRYMLVAAAILYAGLHIYVEHTKADWDNQLLESGKGIILEYFADADNADQPAEADQRFGERT